MRPEHMACFGRGPGGRTCANNRFHPRRHLHPTRRLGRHPAPGWEAPAFVPPITLPEFNVRRRPPPLRILGGLPPTEIAKCSAVLDSPFV